MVNIRLELFLSRVLPYRKIILIHVIVFVQEPRKLTV
jgi:hypothetical protein